VKITGDQILQAGPERQNNIENMISRLQKLGNRSTWESQWVAAEGIYKQCIQVGLETSIEKYEIEGKVWPNVIGIKKGPGKKRNPLQFLLI
jgi:hypothetical protein